MKKSEKNRFDIIGCKVTMKAVITTGNGGYEKLNYRDVPIPKLGPNEVLLQVLAAGVNNTEINTRLGWYSSKVTASTTSLATKEEEKKSAKEENDGGWDKATPFPIVQGTDCCGRVVAAYSEEDKKLINSRVLVRPCIRSKGWKSLENIWIASDFDGAFAQFVKVPITEVFPVDCNWSNSELGTIPCAYGTAENMIHRAKVKKGDIVLITGASGGVGSAAIQLVKRRGANVIAIAGKTKLKKINEIGADKVISRDEDIVEILGEKSVDVVIDNVAGPSFGKMLKVLKRGGQFVSSGAIGGPLVELDMRDFYLKDLTLIGCTSWSEPIFPNLISYIEKGEIKPLLSKTFPLENIVEAQIEFSKKNHVGKFVLIPPQIDNLDEYLL